ncbi:hypothetical protein HanRHA438_Chr16g0749611 [Helianthus annuus]|uniref:Uncharacterized protein n=1 Tax=Helianthus annuus TaxID=4232 RepID=A0A9K3GXW8_HELAN|nr:hypothetical protein HanXRQr2_Chr16g0737341 [Helianthus annuus]KAJ0437362.1 hypothetical protein HanHA300_Chr16g0601191 [Helianthus annuus]KAJ0441775.1 hypothetical protein HanIR_Chr16g0801601 [Helianthus annuus]KAJ0459677.1 hypothetical protein HanHA89_Chr16g0651691 [Helianthus annuus]KAJ0640158.1 hypothetical protein HanLR1_Chr16g0612041 [Helianthus annuus]
MLKEVSCSSCQSAAADELCHASTLYSWTRFARASPPVAFGFGTPAAETN